MGSIILAHFTSRVPGFGAGSWPFVSKQMEMGRGEVEDQRGGGGGEWTEEGEGEGMGRE